MGRERGNGSGFWVGVVFRPLSYSQTVSARNAPVSREIGRPEVFSTAAWVSINPYFGVAPRTNAVGF